MNNAGIIVIIALILAASAGALLFLGSNSHASDDGLSIQNALLCKNSTVREKELCHDLFMRKKIELNNTRELMVELESAMEASEDMKLNCHELAHSIGRVSMLYSNGTVSDIFSQCTQACHSGCFHGAMQAFFLKETLPESDIYELRDAHVSLYDMKRLVNATCADLEDDGAKWFQCLHGMGHAIQFNVDNNLPVALDICDMLNSDYERNSCYGGVVMENVVSPNRESRFVRYDSPQYPCNTLEEKYKSQCYMMQASVMMEIFNYDAGKVVESCKDAGNYVGTCYLSLGRDLSDDFRVGKERAYNTLYDIPSEYRMEYIRGLVYALADNTWDGRYAFPFCSGLDQEELKKSCYSTAINYLNAYLAVDLTRIENSCRAHSPEEQLCLDNLPRRQQLAKPY